MYYLTAGLEIALKIGHCYNPTCPNNQFFPVVDMSKMFL